MSTFMWVTVPGGPTGDGRARVGVALVPRLGGAPEPTLAAHGMDRWPELLAGTRFTIELRAADGSVTGQVVAPALPPAAQMVEDWQALFLAPAQANFTELMPVVEQPAPNAAVRLDVLPTHREATALREVYARGPVGQDWSDQVATLTQARDLRAVRPARVGNTGAAPPLDFHRRVALLRETPAVLRALGLVVDLDVDVPDGVAALRVVPELPAWPAGPVPVNSTPWTLCERVGPAVLPRPRDPEGDVGRGMLRLAGASDVAASEADARWMLASFDVDGAMTRISSVLGAEPSQGATLPGLRSAGLTLIRTGRQAALERRLAAKQADELSAEDLVLGYRFDVRAESDGVWQPLGQRRSTYTLNGREVATGALEEGHIKPDAMARDVDGGLMGDEQVARWDGWSLGCPRPAPGRAAQQSPTALSWTHQPVGPLPRLRFGTTYYLRARVADIVGGGLATDDVDRVDAARETTDAVLYSRVEPVPAPVIGHLAESAVERDLNRLVVRSPGGPGVAASDDEDGRLFSPPPATVELVEQHGLFDAFYDRGESAWDLARRGLEATPTAAAVPGQEVDWLPDPMADEWVLTPVAGPASPLRAARRERWGQWPALTPRRLVVRAGDRLGWSQDGDAVTVSLPMAGQIELDLSSAPRSRDVDLLAVRHWVDVAFGSEVRDQVLAGAQPFLTPAHRLHLVHAVQRPLVAPVVPIIVQRAVGETSATLVASAAPVVDAASTARVELLATWSDATATPAVAPAQSLVLASVPVPWPPVLPPAEWPAVTQPFGDTRRRQVTYQPRAVSRFGDYFAGDGDGDGDPDRLVTLGEPVTLDVPSSARPPVPTIVRNTPGLRWEGDDPVPGWTDVTRVRRGGILRLELGPAWLQSGPGQQLAILASTTPYPTPAIRPFLSEAGRDPVRDTPAPRHFIAPGDVANATAVAATPLAEAPGPVELAVLDPWYDEGSGTWFADIDLGPVANSSRLPFVRLSVAAYQPVSAREDLRLSPRVQTEIVQLLPDRSLALTHQGRGVQVVLSGPPATSADYDSTVRAWLEAWNGGGDPGDAEFTSLTGSVVPAWTRVEGAVADGPAGAPLALVAPDQVGTYRVVVCELDALRTSYADEVGDDLLTRRILFLDAVRL